MVCYLLFLSGYTYPEPSSSDDNSALPVGKKPQSTKTKRGILLVSLKRTGSKRDQIFRFCPLQLCSNNNFTEDGEQKKHFSAMKQGKKCNKWLPKEISKKT